MIENPHPFLTDLHKVFEKHGIQIVRGAAGASIIFEDGSGQMSFTDYKQAAFTSNNESTFRGVETKSEPYPFSIPTTAEKKED
jgi:hypothetical protein